MSSIEWVWEDTYTYFVNALRRTILSDLDVVAIPNKILKKDDDKYGIKIYKNSSKLHNEFIAHRISMLPINLKPYQIAHGVPEFILNKKTKGCLCGKDIQINDNPSSLYSKFAPSTDYIKTNSIVHNSFQIQCPDELSSVLNPVVLDQIRDNSSPMITRLYDSEELDITMRPSISTAKENDVSVCSRQKHAPPARRGPLLYESS